MMMLSAVALFSILVGGVICHPEQSVIKSYKYAQIKRDLGIYLFFICDNSLLIPLKKTTNCFADSPPCSMDARCIVILCIQQ